MSEKNDNGTRYFCPVTGARLTKPGVSDKHDPVNGVPEWDDHPHAHKASNAEDADEEPKHAHKASHAKKDQ